LRIDAFLAETAAFLAAALAAYFAAAAFFANLAALAV
jgi:hypothetical protein